MGDDMDDQDLTNLRRRFGDNLDDWPAPHRQEARDHLAGAIDPLRSALVMPTSEAALSNAVLTRLATPRRANLTRFTPRLALASYAVLLIAAGATGYGLTSGPTTDPILALAFGDGLPAWGSLQ